ncbi:MAG: HD-GYP domain-containing protein [Bacteriovoracia bacterium]
MQSRSILVADHEGSFVNKLLEDSAKTNIPLKIAGSVKEAQLCLSDKNVQFTAVLANQKLPEPGVISLVKFSKFTRPLTPVYLLYQEKSDFTPEIIQKLHIDAIFKKPMSYLEIINAVAPALTGFDSAKALQNAAQNTEALDKEFEAKDTEFLSVRSTDFIAGKKTYFDLYIQLKSGRFVRILKAGDNFAPERLSHYIDSGVDFFYLKRSAQEDYMKFCDQMASDLLNSTSVPTFIKVSATLNQGEQTFNYLRSVGISENNIKHAENFLRNTQKLINQAEFKNNESVKKLLGSLVNYEHGISTTIISALLAKIMNMESDKIVHMLGLASMFHDVGLLSLPEHLQKEENYYKFTSEEKMLFHEHPVKGAAGLRTIKGIDPVVFQAIEQHHERRSKKGFPNHLGAGAINRFAEIIGISDEYICLLKLAEQKRNFSAAHEMKSSIFNGFTYQVTEAFRQIFFDKK